MHYLVFAIVDEPTEEAVKAVMEEHGGGRHWDWYRCGGRWDGYFQGDDEMKARETHDGFNFDDKNDQAATNCIRVSEIGERVPYAFVEGYYFVPRDHYDEFEPNERGGYGAIVETKGYEGRYRDALAKHPDGWVVVVDAHN
jgi:hypothetical protein